MKLNCKVEVMNRVAQSNGFGARSKLGTACRGILQVRNRAHGGRFLVVSTNKDITGAEYNVKNIENVRTKFVENGMATIELSHPPMSILLRDCNPAELREFLSTVQRPPTKNSKIETLETPPEAGKCELENEAAGSLRKTGGAVKRNRSPELSKAEVSRIKRSLSSADKVINVTKRENYPKEVPSTIEKITIKGIGLRKIDGRLLKLRWLTTLDLSENRLTSVDELMKIDSSIKNLDLSRNEIERFKWDFFDAPAFSRLQVLNLSRNKLKILSVSVTSLVDLIQLNLSYNNLPSLPYNWVDMKNLRNVDVSCNNLAFLPATLPLLKLSKLDLSGNQDLQDEMTEHTSDYRGYSEIPTLFEAACGSTMTLNRTRNLQLSTFLPPLIQAFLKSCKYCIICCRLTTRYRLLQFSMTASSLAVEAVTSPGRSVCVMKLMICHECDKKYPNPRAVLPV